VDAETADASRIAQSCLLTFSDTPLIQSIMSAGGSKRGPRISNQLAIDHRKRPRLVAPVNDVSKQLSQLPSYVSTFPQPYQRPPDTVAVRKEDDIYTIRGLYNKATNIMDITDVR
jgi:hypothetical protein